MIIQEFIHSKPFKNEFKKHLKYPKNFKNLLTGELVSILIKHEFCSKKGVFYYIDDKLTVSLAVSFCLEIIHRDKNLHWIISHLK